MNRAKFTLFLALVLGVCSCNDGSNSGSGDGSNAGFVVIESSMNHYNGALQQTGKNGNFESPISLPAGIIGYDTALKQPAQVNCYNYTVEASAVEGGQTVSGTSNTKNTNDTLGVNASVKAKFGLFSTSDSAGYSQSTSSSSQSVNVSAISENQATMNFVLDPTNPIKTEYENYYSADPTMFALLCGDSILTQMPVHNLLIAQVNFFTADSSFNRNKNAQLSGSYGLVKVTADVKASQAGSQSSLNVTFQLNNVGLMDTTALSEAQTALNTCLTNGTDCTEALSQMTPAAANAFTTAMDAIAKDPSSTTWMQYLSPDYTRPSDWVFVNASSVIPNTGDFNSAFTPYVDRVLNATNVFADLQIANTAMTNIASSMETNLSGLPLKNLLYNTAAGMKDLYENRLDAEPGYLISTLNSQIQECLQAGGKGVSTWQAACEAIPEDLTVASAIAADATSHWAVQSQYVDVAKAAYTATVYGLIYDTTIEGSKSDDKLSTLGHFVWMPRTDGQLAIAALPDAHQDSASQGIYYFQNGATKENTYYPANTDFEWFIYNPDEVYQFGINYDQGVTNNGPLATDASGYYLFTELKKSPGGGASCAPFGESSGNCIYYDLIDDESVPEFVVPNYTYTQVDFVPSNPNMILTTQDNYNLGNTPFFFSINPF